MVSDIVFLGGMYYKVHYGQNGPKAAVVVEGGGADPGLEGGAGGGTGGGDGDAGGSAGRGSGAPHLETGASMTPVQQTELVVPVEPAQPQGQGDVAGL